MSKTKNRVCRLISRLRKSDGGVAAVEFAILSPLLIIMIVGVMETGRMLYTRASLQSGLEVAGRYAMVHPNATESELVEVAYGDLKIKGSGGEDPTFSADTETVGGQDFLVLTATLSHQVLIPLMDWDEMELSAETFIPIDS